MADGEAVLLTRRVEGIAAEMIAGGGAGMADAARTVASMRRFAAWNALLVADQAGGVPSLVYGWAQWEAMGRTPGSDATAFRLLSPLRMPTAPAGAGGRPAYAWLPGVRGARWRRRGWLAVTAFDRRDVDGVPDGALFSRAPLPDRGSALKALERMIGVMGADVTPVVDRADVRFLASGPRPTVALDPDRSDLAWVAHVAAHMATDRFAAGDGDRWPAWLVTTMLCHALGLREWSAPGPVTCASPVDALERARLALVRLLAAVPDAATVTSGRGSSRLVPVRGPSPVSPAGGPPPFGPSSPRGVASCGDVAMAGSCLVCGVVA